MRGLGVFLLGALLVACGSPAPSAAPVPTPAPSSSPAPTPSATPAPTPDLPSLPLPANVAGIPPSGEVAISIDPHTPADSVPVGVEQTFTLGHCGLISPIDIDGSLWDPIAGDDGFGGPLTEDQLGDLINETPVALVLVDHETMLMLTHHAARIVLTRHDGPRFYFGCD